MLSLRSSRPGTLASVMAASVCAALWIAGQAQAQAVVSSQPGAISCDQWQWSVSQDFGQPVNITFINNTDGPRPVQWIDFTGNPVDMGWLDQGQSLSFNTDLGHVWAFTDPPGNCLEMFSPQAGQSTFYVTVPMQYFGTE